MSTQMASTMEGSNHTDVGSEEKPQMIFRCKKCRRIVASQEHIVPHERGEGEKCFKWKKRSSNSKDMVNEPPECSSIFVEPMKWMQAVEEGNTEQKLQCIGCNARLGSFNWAGMQCNCGAWVNPAFQLHKSRIDECRF
ncbi:probable inactive dual specificity protein phosphatase-like At4g18593 [Cynara cardunculus var. scolymus]|uniref:probable inactive dual specificity protein phosphatase-like At4g18593 n=1 Tax=Cynara cardunculus var. scolymus TaxID=59895 RepID=UPI000D62569E|nr:probable inactive dual specificity protein phosphatase-like At4g18593 [Cynara cardunculus var. scolymus]